MKLQIAPPNAELATARSPCACYTSNQLGTIPNTAIQSILGLSEQVIGGPKTTLTGLIPTPPCTLNPTPSPWTRLPRGPQKSLLGATSAAQAWAAGVEGSGFEGLGV